MEMRSAYSCSNASTTSFARGMRPILVRRPDRVACGRARWSGPPQEPEQQGLLRVETILRLVPHHRMGAVDDLVGDLLPAVGGQAVHDDRVGLGPVHSGLVQLEALEHEWP